MTNYGELMPLGGGDPIPLLKPALVVGRRESTDIVLRFPNVSGQHCELTIVDGYWVVKDLGSSNGTKVNGSRVTEQRLEPGDTLSIAKHEFEIAYEPARLGATAAPPEESPKAGLFSRSLLEAAGLESRRPPERRVAAERPAATNRPPPGDRPRR
jgi:predicted component of type VI protein secretion system